MWQLRSLLADPRLHFLGLLVVVLLVLAGTLTRSDSALCLACPGHKELARDCLCYHVPATPDSLRH